MFALFKNQDAVKKYLLIFFLGIVSLSMVVVMAPLPGGDTVAARGQRVGLNWRPTHYQRRPGSDDPRPVQKLSHGL